MLWIAQPRFFPLGHCTHVFISREMPLAWICLGVYNIPLLTRAMTSICGHKGVEEPSTCFSRQDNSAGQTAVYIHTLWDSCSQCIRPGLY